MPDEVNYEAHLMDVKDAVKHLFPDEALVVRYSWDLFCWVRSLSPCNVSSHTCHFIRHIVV
jgi:hypothetical protein